MRRLLYICILVLSAMSMMAENYASNARAEQVERTMVITYDLSKTANVRLLVSTNMSNDFKEVKKVTGAVGKNVQAGANRQITWNVLEEYDRFVADGVRFKVEAYGADTQTFTVNGVSFTMIGVKGGTFTMGATSEQGTSEPWDHEYPTHSVTLSNFAIGETEVTQELWRAVMGSNPSRFSGTNLPVEQVSWNDCQTFITKLNQLTGKNFRLPTEAEWEYAARGGNKSKGDKYAGSNTLGDVAWYEGNGSGRTHPVKQKQANELGLYDMSGNVWEWCQDWFGTYSSSAQTNPTGPASGSNRVRRGGSWYYNARYCRVSFRYNNTPAYYNSGLGLRLAL